MLLILSLRLYLAPGQVLREQAQVHKIQERVPSDTRSLQLLRVQILHPRLVGSNRREYTRPGTRLASILTLCSNLCYFPEPLTAKKALEAGVVYNNLPTPH